MTLSKPEDHTPEDMAPLTFPEPTDAEAKAPRSDMDKLLREERPDLGGAKAISQVVEILRRVEYPEHDFFVGVLGGGYYIQLRYREADVVTGEVSTQHGRKFYVSVWATESEIVQTCLTAALASAEHRVREHFTYQPVGTDEGRAIYGPHFDAKALWAICQSEWTDARPAKVEQG